MVDPYAALLALALLVAGFLITLLALASRLGPKHRTPTKQLPFECGSVSVGAASTQRFNVRFYLVAVLFILFDIEIVFLYPWALVLESLGWYAFFSMLAFMLVLGIGLLYVWRKGVLDWNA